MKYFISQNTSIQACNRLIKNYYDGQQGCRGLINIIVADKMPTMRHNMVQ